MDSVLKKTVASLETALKYNPNNVELMTSLAEGYIRMGRFNGETIELCEKVLSKYPDNPMLQQAQAVAYVIEQTDQIEAGLAMGKAPPCPEDIFSSIDIINELLERVTESTTIWFTWSRLSLLAGSIEHALTGLRHLENLEYENMKKLRPVLDWVTQNQPGENMDWYALKNAYRLIGDEGVGVLMIEEVYDSGSDLEPIGRLLLEHYLNKYNPSNADSVPETMRPRLFQLLLDYGDTKITGEWLRRAALFGWEITNFSKSYVRDLVKDEQYDVAFEILQRLPMDGDAKALLNEIANHYESVDDYDNAVKILQFINSHEIVESDHRQQQEVDLAVEMELSMAELNMKNSRTEEALSKYVSALCLGPEPDLIVLDKIDEILSDSARYDPTILLRLSAYFRKLKDHPKTVYYLNHILDHDNQHSEALHELESLFDEILHANPDNTELRLELGKVYQKLGRVEDAIVEFKSAVAGTSMTDRGNRALACVYRENGNLVEALACYQAITPDENDLESIYQLHLDFSEVGDLASAKTALEMIMRVKADYREVAARMRELGVGTNSNHFESASDSKMKELIGDLAVGRYRHIEKVGSGGMGIVHKVMDLRQQKITAMKILRDGLAGSSKALDRFFREARIAASIHHRNIVEIYDYNISSIDGQSYISMEYIEGPSLREIIDDHFEATISIGMSYITEMLYYCVQLFDALEGTHDRGIVHRDIKPDNIMITHLGEVKITDFGIVHVEEATFTPTGAMLGTPRYMAPEQVTGGKITGACDIYAVGILLYEILTGSPPFMTGDISYQQVHKQPTAPRAVNPVVPQSIDDFIMQCLQKAPGDRPSSARESKKTMVDILESLGGCNKFSSMTAVADDVGSESIKKSRQDSPPPRDSSENGINDHRASAPAADPIEDRERPSDNIADPQPKQVRNTDFVFDSDFDLD